MLSLGAPASIMMSRCFYNTMDNPLALKGTALASVKLLETWIANNLMKGEVHPILEL